MKETSKIRVYWKWTKGWSSTSRLVDIVKEYYDSTGEVRFAKIIFSF